LVKFSLKSFEIFVLSLDVGLQLQRRSIEVGVAEEVENLDTIQPDPLGLDEVEEPCPVDPFGGPGRDSAQSHFAHDVEVHVL